MAQIKITDSFITDAARAIADFRSKNEIDPPALPIEQQLRSYIYLATTKQITDWSYKSTAGVKDDIVTKTINRTQDQYLRRLVFATVYTNFEILETLAATGAVSPIVARPREAQDNYDKQLADAHANDKSPVQKGIEDFFGVAKSSIESALKGLGLNIPLEVIIILAVVLAVILFTRAARPA